jgi:FAD/FMN-containing dehydrogenase
MDYALIDQFIALVGEKYALTSVDDLTHYTHENRGLFVGNTPLVLKPSNTEEVSEILKLAASTKTVIVPQGGHTGHVGGAVSDESGTQVVLSLERMTEIREVDLEGDVIICEAGVILETVQRLADDNDRLFPLALGSQGSCQIGGNISTNAGGTGVLAYGNTRALVMGLEVVLPSGEIWNGLRRLKKDNTGYDLKDLFIGAEGTLGIITAAVLKLFPKPRGKAVAFCGVQSPEHALQLFTKASSYAGQSLTAFELMARIPLEFTLQHMDNVRNPLEEIYPWHVLCEVSSNRSQTDADETLQAILEAAFMDDVICDAALSTTISQADDFWRIREMMPVAQKHEGGSMKHDVSVPLHLVPEFLTKAGEIMVQEMPDARLCTFGHLGDGNMHYNISQPTNANTKEFLAKQPEINKLIHALVINMNGSVAAEHGVGRLKRDLIAQTKDPVELNLMKSIKRTLDPDNIVNPGKLL